MRIPLFLFCINIVIGEEDGGLETFRALFRQKRVEHLAAAHKLQSFDSVERRDKLLNSMLEKMWLVMAQAKLNLEKKPEMTGLGVPMGGDHHFSQLDQETKNTIALFVENVCFLSDILLRFPTFVHSKFEKNSDALLVYKWGLSYMEQSGILSSEDTPTYKLLDLASQEIGVKEKSPEYRNPYSEKSKQRRFADPPEEPKKKKRKKLPRGPKMSRVEL